MGNLVQIGGHTLKLLCFEVTMGGEKCSSFKGLDRVIKVYISYFCTLTIIWKAKSKMSETIRRTIIHGNKYMSNNN